jgi:hypothetical protein
MRAKPSAKTTRILSEIVVILALVVLVGSLRTAKVDIATAVTAVRPGSGVAARTAENIRYQDNNLEVIAVYRIVDGHLDDAATADHRHIWDIAEATLPAEDLAHIHQLNIVTDGPARTLGMVHRSTTEHDAWILSIDPAESDDVLQRTLVHELGHIFTLDEADLTAQRTNCTGTLIEIGCARAGSPLADYANRFWAGVAEPGTYSSDTFVTQYAADSVHEDLAETFMAWVYGDKAGSTTIAAKYRWFDGIDFFVTAKAEIRAKLQLT